jgi:hypothetical protein
MMSSPSHLPGDSLSVGQQPDTGTKSQLDGVHLLAVWSLRTSFCRIIPAQPSMPSHSSVVTTALPGMVDQKYEETMLSQCIHNAVQNHKAAHRATLLLINPDSIRRPASEHDLQWYEALILLSISTALHLTVLTLTRPRRSRDVVHVTVAQAGAERRVDQTRLSRVQTAQFGFRGRERAASARWYKRVARSSHERAIEIEARVASSLQYVIVRGNDGTTQNLITTPAR